MDSSLEIKGKKIIYKTKIQKRSFTNVKLLLSDGGRNYLKLVEAFGIKIMYFPPSDHDLPNSV